MPPVCHPCPASSPGLAVLRTPEPLALGHWHRVSAERLNKDGSLRVNSRRPVLRSSPGKSQGLNLHTLLYLGGVEPSVRLPPATNVSAHFRGCVGEVRSGLQRTRGEGRGGEGADGPLCLQRAQMLPLGPHFPPLWIRDNHASREGPHGAVTAPMAVPGTQEAFGLGSSLACARVPPYHSCFRLGPLLSPGSLCLCLPHAQSPSPSLCLQVSVNGKRLDLTYSFLGSRGIGQCYTSSPCERQPCQNRATCMPTGEYEFQCLCPDGFKGVGARQVPAGGGTRWSRPLPPVPTHCALAHRRPL